MNFILFFFVPSSCWCCLSYVSPVTVTIDCVTPLLYQPVLTTACFQALQSMLGWLPSSISISFLKYTHSKSMKTWGFHFIFLDGTVILFQNQYDLKVKFTLKADKQNSFKYFIDLHFSNERVQMTLKF